MAPLPRTLPPWRWNFGQHLCTPEAPALGPRKITALGENITLPKGKTRGAALQELSLRPRPASSHTREGVGGPRILGFLKLLSSGQ